VAANIAEAWYRRRYQKSFVNKLIEAAGEAGETEVWIDFSFSHGYLDENKRDYLIGKYDEEAKMLRSMIKQSEKFCY
jgi:four helix bundle protein